MRIKTTFQAKTIRAAIQGGEALSFIGLSVGSVEYEAAIADLKPSLRRAHYVGSKRHFIKLTRHYAEA